MYVAEDNVEVTLSLADTAGADLPDVLIHIDTYRVRAKKNATNVPQRHLKTWWYVRRFSPTKSAAH